MTTTHAALVEIHWDTLARLLNLPAKQYVTRAEYSISKDCLVIRIEGEGLPIMPAGCSAMCLRPDVKTVERAELDWTKVSNG